MSEIFGKISKTVTDAGKAVGEKTKQVSETAKLNAKIVSSEHTVNENYYALGKFCYEKCKDNPTNEEAKVYIDNITAALNSIDEVKARLLSIKGAIKCKSCGNECPIDDSFCGKCGAALEKPEPPVPAPVEDEAEAVEAVVEEKTEE